MEFTVGKKGPCVKPSRNAESSRDDAFLKPIVSVP